MSKVESSSFNAESSYYSPKSSVSAIQVALVAITLVGGVTAAFALVGYLPSVAVWPGAIGGGGAFIAFIVITVKRCCADDYRYLEGDVEEQDLEESVSREVVRETSAQDKFFLRAEADADDDYDFASETDGEESQPFESEPQAQLYDPFSYHNFVSELALHVLSYLNVKSLLAASCINRKWRVLATDETLWKFIYTSFFYTAPEQMLNTRQECIKSLRMHWEQKQRSIDEDGVFTNAVEKVQNPSMKKIIAGNPERIFLTDSFLVVKISNKKSYLYNLSPNKVATPLIAKTRFLKFEGKSDRAIEMNFRIKQENGEDRYLIANIADLKNKEFGVLREVRRPGYKVTFSCNNGNYVYRVWLSNDKATRIIHRWDALTEKSVEITIPCRIDSDDGHVLPLITIESWKNQLVCAYSDGVRELWNLSTHEKKELSLNSYTLPQSVNKKLGIVWKIERYSILQNYEIMTGKSLKARPGDDFICIRNLETEEFVFSKAIVKSKIIFSKAFDDKVLCVLLKGRILKYDLKAKKETSYRHLESSDESSCFFIYDGKLIMGSRYGYLSIWDLDKKKRVYNKQISEYEITNIDAKGQKIAVSSYDSVAIIDFSSPDDIKLTTYH